MSFRLDISYPWHPGIQEQHEEKVATSVEEAAQIFESTAQVPANYTLAQIVEELSLEGRVEYQDPESGRTVAVEREGDLEIRATGMSAAFARQVTKP